VLVSGLSSWKGVYTLYKRNNKNSIYTYIHIYIHTHTHTYMHANMHKYKMAESKP
jgi:hypothetical protein